MAVALAARIISKLTNYNFRMSRAQYEKTFVESFGPLLRGWRRAADHLFQPYGLSTASVRPLLIIGRHRDGIRHGALAGELSIEGASLVRLLERLIAANLVSRTTDPDDKRAVNFTLTAQGARLYEQLEQALVAFRAAMLADVSDDDLDTCLRVFCHLQAKFSAEHIGPKA